MSSVNNRSSRGGGRIPKFRNYLPPKTVVNDHKKISLNSDENNDLNDVQNDKFSDFEPEDNPPQNYITIDNRKTITVSNDGSDEGNDLTDIRNNKSSDFELKYKNNEFVVPQIAVKANTHYTGSIFTTINSDEENTFSPQSIPRHPNIDCNDQKNETEDHSATNDFQPSNEQHLEKKNSNSVYKSKVMGESKGEDVEAKLNDLIISAKSTTSGSFGSRHRMAFPLANQKKSDSVSKSATPATAPVQFKTTQPKERQPKEQWYNSNSFIKKSTEENAATKKPTPKQPIVTNKLQMDPVLARTMTTTDKAGLPSRPCSRSLIDFFPPKFKPPTDKVPSRSDYDSLEQTSSRPPVKTAMDEGEDSWKQSSKPPTTTKNEQDSWQQSFKASTTTRDRQDLWQQSLKGATKTLGNEEDSWQKSSKSLTTKTTTDEDSWQQSFKAPTKTATDKENPWQQSSNPLTTKKAAATQPTKATTSQDDDPWKWQPSSTTVSANDHQQKPYGRPPSRYCNYGDDNSNKEEKEEPYIVQKKAISVEDWKNKKGNGKTQESRHFSFFSSSKSNKISPSGRLEAGFDNTCKSTTTIVYPWQQQQRPSLPDTPNISYPSDEFGGNKSDNSGRNMPRFSKILYVHQAPQSTIRSIPYHAFSKSLTSPSKPYQYQNEPVIRSSFGDRLRASSAKSRKNSQTILDAIGLARAHFGGDTGSPPEPVIKRSFSGQGLVVPLNSCENPMSGNQTEVFSIYSKAFVPYNCALQKLPFSDSGSPQGQLKIGDWVTFDGQELEPEKIYDILRYTKIQSSPPFSTTVLHNTVIVSNCPVTIPNEEVIPETQLDSELSERVFDTYRLIKSSHLGKTIKANLSYFPDYQMYDPSGHWRIESINDDD